MQSSQNFNCELARGHSEHLVARSGEMSGQGFVTVVLPARKIEVVVENNQTSFV